MDGSAKLPPPASVGITELKNNVASIAKRVHDTAVPCTVLKQGRAYVAIVPVDPGYRTMGNYACNQYTRVLRRLFAFFQHLRFFVSDGVECGFRCRGGNAVFGTLGINTALALDNLPCYAAFFGNNFDIAIALHRLK